MEGCMNFLKLRKKNWLCSSLFFSLLFLNVIIIGDTSFAQSEKARLAKLMEGAKQEGKVVWYTAMSTDSNDAVRKAFEKKYPFIKVEIFRSRGPKLNAKVLMENRSGRHLWDVINSSGFNMHELQKYNLFDKYFSPEGEAVPQKYRDSEGYWAAVYLSPLVPGYNTRLVEPRDVPKSYYDLLDPKWKGKMAFDLGDVEWFANFWKLKGENQCLHFMEQLAKQDLYMMTGHTLQAQMLAAGEFALGVNLYAYRLEYMKGRGAPVDWVALEPSLTYFFPSSVAVKAPHPNGAILFQDFILSKEGQQIIASSGRLPARQDVTPKFPRLVYNWQPSDISLVEDFEKYQKLFLKIFKKSR